MKRRPLRRISTKRQLQMKEQRQERYKMLIFFMLLWKERPHICESCGKHLPDESRTYMFDHLLEKSKYPELALDENNIYLCCWDCHSLKTNGHPTEKHQEAILAYKINIGI